MGKGEAVHWPQHSSRGSVLDAGREGRGRFRRIQTLRGGGGGRAGGRRDGDGRVLQAECMTRSTDTVFNNVFGVSEKVLRRC